MEAQADNGVGAGDDGKRKRTKRVRVDGAGVAVSATVGVSAVRRSLNLSISPETYKRAKMFAAYVDRDLSDLFTEWLGNASRGFVVSQRGSSASGSVDLGGVSGFSGAE